MNKFLAALVAAAFLATGSAMADTTKTTKKVVAVKATPTPAAKTTKKAAAVKATPTPAAKTTKKTAVKPAKAAPTKAPKK